MAECTCQKWNFTEILLEDTGMPTEFYHISANDDYVIAAGKDNYLRVWSRQKKSSHFFRIQMPSDILAIGISAVPERIYVSTKEYVKVFTIRPEAKGTALVYDNAIHYTKIRTERGLLILCSKAGIIAIRFQEEKKLWHPDFLIAGYDLDAVLVHESKFLVLSVREEVLLWRIYDYEELVHHTVRFQPLYHWSAAENDLPVAEILDTSSTGLCLISSSESDLWVLNLMKEGDNPTPGWAGNGGENNSGGYGRFLRSCGIDAHQEPFIFCGTKYLEWAVCQKHARGDQMAGQYQDISGWQSDNIVSNEDYPVFPLCYHSSSGLAFVWNSAGSSQKVSAVILLDYTEQKGNCRLYKGSDYIDNYYSG